MHIDARELTADSQIEGDICIVGAGAAGISIALEWVHSNARVILLEGGGFNLEASLQDLYRGEITGKPYYPLQAARLHYFGGTTGHWAGFCSPYDSIDFQRRRWVPNSGWPITRKQLDPYYRRAQQLVELGPYEYDPGYWEDQDADVVRLPYDRRKVHTKMWQFSPPTRFGTRYREAIVNAPNLQLYTNANVCEIAANESVNSIEHLHIRTFDGKQHKVKARYYILACGSIQNARLLLASNRRANTGLGNRHDLVGRYFMEHVEMPVAELVLQRPRPLKMYLLNYGQTRSRGELALTPASQREYRLLNGTVSLNPGGVGNNPRGTFQEFPAEVVLQYSDQSLPSPAEKKTVTEGRATPATPAPASVSPYQVFKLTCRHEQSPNPDSRVRLGPDQDALGMPRAELHWQLTSLDKRSIRKSCEILARETGRSRLGRVRLLEWLTTDNDDEWPDFLSGGWHHMGTTRMHEDPRQGVVDADCRVHGINNLYLAGASVFPTGGASNPTLTLIALSLRLSDYIKRQVGDVNIGLL